MVGTRVAEWRAGRRASVSGMDRRRRRNRRGGAMLELALLLPLYMLVFFIVWTAGDIGLVSTQSHIGARYAAWRRHPDSPDEIQKAIGGGTIRAQALNSKADGVVGYARAPGSGYVHVDLSYWQADVRKEAFSARTYDLEVPLAWNGRETPHPTVSISEDTLDDVIKRHDDNRLSSSELLDLFPADFGDVNDFKYSEKMLAAAMEGDYGYGDEMPWLQRHTAMTAMTMRGAAGIASRTLFRSTHTVLLGTRYFTTIPRYYSQIGSGVMMNGIDADFIRDHYDRVAPVGRARAQREMLRGSQALRDERGGDSLTRGGKLHQLHFIHARTDLTPPF